ncbi:hypothetical protein FOZ63_030974 [Perkinsus olseni]|uniref:Uncharacterized protein n=1 Tax=Perkinsus olseni TaxID=32597 RepID=A0A7J6RPH7_PEROL|nr:hypothetical protein FOZ63_030974 [Perkinsus olseni]
MAVRLRTTSHPENPANKIQPGMHVKKASTKGRVLGQDKPSIPDAKPTGVSSIGVARQGSGNFPDMGSLMPSSVTRKRTPGPREGTSRTSEEDAQLRVRQGEAAAWNPGPKRKSLVGVASAAAGSYLDIDSLLPLPVMKRPPSRPTHEGFPRASGNAGKVQVLQEGEPSALRDGSGGKSSVIGPGSSESGNRPEFHLLLPSLAESRSNVKSGDATRPHKTASGRGVGPVENLLASLEGGWLVKPSTHPPRSQSVAMKAGADGARASKRQKTSHAASISRRLTENEPGKVIPHSEDTGEHRSEKTDLGPNTPAVQPRESASGGGHGGFGFFPKIRSPNGAEGNPPGSSQVRSLRPSDEEPNLETQLSISDNEIPEWSTTPTEKQGVGIDPDFDAFFVPSNVTWSDLLSPESGVLFTEEPRGLSIDEQLAIEDGGLLDFLDPDKQWKWS